MLTQQMPAPDAHSAHVRVIINTNGKTTISYPTAIDHFRVKDDDRARELVRDRLCDFAAVDGPALVHVQDCGDSFFVRVFPNGRVDVATSYLRDGVLYFDKRAGDAALNWMLWAKADGR